MAETYGMRRSPHAQLSSCAASSWREIAITLIYPWARISECNRTGGPFSTCLRSDVTAGQAPLLQILLVIVLGGIELDCSHNLGDDRLRVTVRLIERFLRGLGLRRLFEGVKEDRGAVLRAPVRALTV